MVSRKARKAARRKIHLDKAGKQTKWAPFWVVVKKFGQGKKVHPSSVTHVKRSWSRTNLKIKPRTVKKKHLG